MLVWNSHKWRVSTNQDAIVFNLLPVPKPHSVCTVILGKIGILAIKLHSASPPITWAPHGFLCLSRKRNPLSFHLPFIFYSNKAVIIMYGLISTTWESMGNWSILSTNNDVWLNSSSTFRHEDLLLELSCLAKEHFIFVNPHKGKYSLPVFLPLPIPPPLLFLLPPPYDTYQALC